MHRTNPHSPEPTLIGRLERADRAAGQALRSVVDRDPRIATLARGAAHVMSPLFRGIVGVLIIFPRTRRTGVEALVSAVSAAMIAREARDRLGRRRPGRRTEGGFPSRHAAAATAIADSVGSRHPRSGGALMLLAAVGMVGRVHSRDHDPGDLVAGAMTGVATARVVATTRWALSQAIAGMRWLLSQATPTR